MNFLPGSIFVSHAGLPTGLDTRQDWTDYIEDVEKEIAALDLAWRDFQKDNEPSREDLRRYETASGKLEELHADAIRQWRSMRGGRPGLTG